jgi:glycosyltransferase involved in cell wall biosynthesis
VLFIGSFRPNKGIDDLIEAILGVPESTGYRFRFVGAGDERIQTSVRRLAASRSDVTASIGRYSDDQLIDELLNADVIALPYRSFHSQSGVLLDAYRAGVPVIATDVGALGATVRCDGSGWVIAPGDREALLRALAEVADPVVRAERRRAISAAVGRHSPGQVADSLIGAYCAAGWSGPATNKGNVEVQ